MSTIQEKVTRLIKWERVEMSLSVGNEIRQYLERVIHTAAVYGPKDPEAMKLADYYINDKHLIHKLFQVIVPRYDVNVLAMGNYSRLYRVKPRGDGINPRQTQERCVLELVGNPFPPLEPATTKPHKNNLLNVLLRRLKNRFEERQTHEVNSIAPDKVAPASIKLHKPDKLDAYETEHKLDRVM